MQFLNNVITQPFALKALEVVAGLISLFSLKWKIGGQTLTMKEIMKELDRKNEENIRLQVEIEGWKMHHRQLTKTRHLH